MLIALENRAHFSRDRQEITKATWVIPDQAKLWSGRGARVNSKQPMGNSFEIRGRLLARNTLLNFVGLVTPLFLGVLCIPFLVRGLGVDRFGVLTLTWTIVGYMSLFDLGLGRALTQLVAGRLGTGQKQGIAPLVWTSLLLIFGLGMAGGAVLALLSPWLVRDVLRIPEALQVETLRASYLLAGSIPFVVHTTGLRGILEALQRFGLINAVRIPMGVLTYLGPLLVLSFSRSLFPVVAVLVAGRFFAWLMHLWLCLRVMPELCHGIGLERSEVGPLIRFGSWITVSNLVGPLMVYLDRFLIGSLVSIASVAYYATPFDVVTRLWLIPGAVGGVLFPAFAASFAQDRSRTAFFLGRGIKYVFLVLFPLTLIIVTFAHEGLALWLGNEFARNSTRVLQWLAVGVFINSLALIPFTLVQGVGRPDLTSKLHLIELPFYLLAAYWAIGAYGVGGAAIVWVMRVAVDAFILFMITKRLLPSGSVIFQRTILAMGFALLTLVFATLPVSLAMKGLFVLVTLLAFALAAWFVILVPEERALVENRLKIIHSFLPLARGKI